MGIKDFEAILVLLAEALAHASGDFEKALNQMIVDAELYLGFAHSDNPVVSNMGELTRSVWEDRMRLLRLAREAGLEDTFAAWWRNTKAPFSDYMSGQWAESYRHKIEIGQDLCPTCSNGGNSYAPCGRCGRGIKSA